MTVRVGNIQQVLTTLWPRSADLAFPQRVQAAITDYDNSSEVLVKVIQFIVFSLWGLAYLAAPQPDPNTTSIVPLVIIAYLIFTAVGLFLALRDKPLHWLIYPSIAIDMALLTFVIWSFHIQYQQEASFSLKSVEVMNFFVLISLRSLRFQSRYVLAAGGFAMLFWSALVAYVVSTDPVDPMITRDYLTYLTSNTVLIGAEISKLISIAMFTVILAVAVRRAQYFVVASVAEASAAKDLSRFMADPVAKQIRGSETQIEAGQGVRRDVAILNVDIRGFTNLVAEMESGEAMSLLSDYQHQIVPIVHRHNGVVDKFMGDGVLITFGTSGDDPHLCANALRCIQEIDDSQKNWTGPAAKLRINMAVAVGPVIYGAVGDGDRLELTVIGASVNRSAKLEKHNRVLGTKALATLECYNQAVAQGFPADSRYRNLSTVIGDDAQVSDVVVLV